MKYKFRPIFCLLIIVGILLVACSSESESTSLVEIPTEAAQAIEIAPEPTALAVQPDVETEEPTTEALVTEVEQESEAADVTQNNVEVSTSLTSLQLILGTIGLQESDLAITDVQASGLLPLWIEFRSASFSGGGPGGGESADSNEAGTEDLATEIQAAMTAEQLSAIVEMGITQESMTTFIEEQGMTLGGPGGGTPPEGGEVPAGEGAPEGEGGQPPEQPGQGGFSGGPGGGEFVPPPLIDFLIQYLAETSGQEVDLQPFGPGADAGAGSGASASIDCDSVAVASSNIVDTEATEGSVSDNSTNVSYILDTTYIGSLTSFTQRSDEFSIGYFICDGEIISASSILSDLPDSVAETTSLTLDLSSDGVGFTPVYASGEETELLLTGYISASDESGGLYASDFTGAGSQIVASNDAEVIVDNMTIETDGFMRDALIVDENAEMVVTNSSITTMGANPLIEAYDGFENNANLNTMIATPWVLGIQGGVRAANVLGNNATLSVIDSEITSGSWAILSIDSGSNSVINVLDSSLVILPEAEGGMSSGDFSYSDEYGSGYGSYIIGNATQNFYGASISGTTYGAILTGGSATYQSSSGSITLENAKGETIGTYDGDGLTSTIDSVFGFMSHNSGSITVLDGTEVNAEEAIFLYKAGDVTFTADSASLNSDSGVIFQMIDNDDATIGLKDTANVIFNTTFSEEAGWPSENGSVTESGGQSNLVNLNLTNGNYSGDIYNGTGYYGQSGDSLNVTLGSGATLNGAISLTETRHIDENGEQNTEFTIEAYYYLGHVENRAFNNGNSDLTLTLTDGAVWQVSGTSYLTSLTIVDGTLEAGNGMEVSMQIDGVETAIESGNTYTGDIVITVN